jgi:hypothetical protein
MLMNLLHLFDTLCFLIFVNPQKISKLAHNNSTTLWGDWTWIVLMSINHLGTKEWFLFFGMCVRVQYNNATSCKLRDSWNKGMIFLFSMCVRVQYNNCTTCGLKATWNKGMIRHVWEGAIQQFHKLRADSQLEQRNDCCFWHVWESAVQQFGLLGTESPGGLLPVSFIHENWIRNGPCPTTPMKLNFIVQTSHSVHGYYAVREIFKWIPFKRQSTWGM